MSAASLAYRRALAAAAAAGDEAVFPDIERSSAAVAASQTLAQRLAAQQQRPVGDYERHAQVMQQLGIGGGAATAAAAAAMAAKRRVQPQPIARATAATNEQFLAELGTAELDRLLGLSVRRLIRECTRELDPTDPGAGVGAAQVCQNPAFWSLWRKRHVGEPVPGLDEIDRLLQARAERILQRTAAATNLGSDTEASVDVEVADDDDEEVVDSDDSLADFFVDTEATLTPEEEELQRSALRNMKQFALLADMPS